MGSKRRARDDAAREREEIAFWERDNDEGDGRLSLDLLTHKMGEARVFLEKCHAFATIFSEPSQTVVELGGGQCWASAIVKAQHADAHVVATDIAHGALRGSGAWEQQFGSRIDALLATKSAALPLRSASCDLVFAFASAHHFTDHERTLDEIARVLRPGGHALYLHEPACRDWIYPLALRRVLAKRPEVPEDVLRYRRIEKLGRAAGLDVQVVPAPTTTYRGAVETVYYLVLQKLRFLQRVLPCTVDFVFTKPI